MSNAVEVIHPDFPNQSSAVAPAPQPNAIVTPMMMLANAVERSADIATIERIAALVERMQKHEAAMLFTRAFAAAKAGFPPIYKNRKGHNSAYADFFAVERAVSPVLAHHGIYFKHRTTQMPDGAILVTCELRHEGGHCEESSLSSKPASANSAMNAQQAIGATQTYLMRYTLLALLGVAPTDDTDAATPQGGAESGTINDEQAQEIEDLIIGTGGEVSAFLQFKRLASIHDIRSKDFAATVSEIKRIAAKRAEKRNG